jgi:Tol biopolymer transport system component
MTVLRFCLLFTVVGLCAGPSHEDTAARVVLRQAWNHAATGRPAAAISADGRYVAFASAARLLSADTNTLDDIYVFDRDSRRLVLATQAHGGGTSTGNALNPDLSSDGQYLVFDARATNLTGGPDRNDYDDVFVRDNRDGLTRRISVASGGVEANGRSMQPALSGDGRWVVFESNATNLVAGADVNGTGSDIFLADLATMALTRVSVDSASRQFARAFSARISGDGRLVVFVAAHQNRPAGAPDANSGLSVYMRDVVAKTTTCISCDPAVSAGRVAAFAPEISSDGRIVAFAVQTTEARSDIVVYDRKSLTATTITRRANARSTGPRLSRDGNVVAFDSWASNLLCAGRCHDADVDENLLPDVYLFDRTTQRFSRASGAATTWWTPSVGPAIDGTGQVVVFSSREPFGPEDLTSDFDLFVCSPVCS